MHPSASQCTQYNPECPSTSQYIPCTHYFPLHPNTPQCPQHSHCTPLRPRTSQCTQHFPVHPSAPHGCPQCCAPTPGALIHSGPRAWGRGGTGSHWCELVAVSPSTGTPTSPNVVTPCCHPPVTPKPQPHGDNGVTLLGTQGHPGVTQHSDPESRGHPHVTLIGSPRCHPMQTPTASQHRDTPASLPRGHRGATQHGDTGATLKGIPRCDPTQGPDATLAVPPGVTHPHPTDSRCPAPPRTPEPPNWGPRHPLGEHGER